MTEFEFITAARSWLGVPFLHQGRNRHGVDCIGLILCTLKEKGSLPEDLDLRADYGRRPTKELVTELQRRCVKIDTPQLGCLLSMKWPQHGEVSHVAIYAGQTIIHSAARLGYVTEQGFRGAYEKWTRGYYLIPGVSYE